jgi:hypothetical protein
MYMRLYLSTHLKTCLFVAFAAVSSFGCGGDDSSPGGGGPGGLTAPAELKAMVLPGPAVHLTWKDTPTEHHFSIERKTGTGAFMEISTENINIMAHHDASVTAGTTYTYRIAGASSSNEKSPYSNEVTVTVP